MHATRSVIAIWEVAQNMDALRIDTASTLSSARPADVKYERILYGLPCAGCGTYYASHVELCPICQSSERVPADPRQ